MRIARRLLVLLLAAALAIGAPQSELALASIPNAADTGTPCEHSDCDEPQAPGIGCRCIKYPASHAAGRLAVFAAAAIPIAPGAMRTISFAAGATLGTRGDPRDPPPPRLGARRDPAAG